MNYVLLGNPHTRTLEKQFNRSYQIHEKVSINFRSSLAYLQEYFEKIFFIPIELLSGEKVLGTAEIKVNPLIKTTSLQEFLEKNPTSYLEVDEICNLQTSHDLIPNTNRPIVECKLSIRYIATKKLHQTELLEKYNRYQEVDSQAGGDFSEERQPSVKSPKHKTLSDIPETCSEIDPSNHAKFVGVAKSIDTKHRANVILEPNPSTSRSEKDNIESILNSTQKINSAELPRLFSYNLQITKIKFNRTPEKGIWQFSFSHDKSDTPRAFINKELNHNDLDIDNLIALSDFELKLFFTAAASQITDLLTSSDSCTLCIKGPRGTLAKAQLDCQSLLIDNEEKVPGLVLLQDKLGQCQSLLIFPSTSKILGKTSTLGSRRQPRK